MAVEGEHFEAVIIGAGAAGLAAAIFLARRQTNWRIGLFDGAPKIGAKILISGGGRCNVTNQTVSAADYWGGSPHVIRRVLDRFTVADTVAFFREIGVELKSEPEFGKLFPRSDSARTVLQALIDECRRGGVRLFTGRRVHAIVRSEDGFEIRMSDPAAPVIAAQRVLLATGGQSFPKTGSDGTGFRLAQSLGHGLVPPIPALAALVLDGSFHSQLSGVTVDVELAARVEGRRVYQRRGPLLWTHFGVSGPEAMNVSRIWHRAKLENHPTMIVANLAPGETAETIDTWLRARSAQNPRTMLASALAERIPARIAVALLGLTNAPDVPLAHLSREIRRAIANALTEFPLAVRDSRGFAHAEATAGGIPLSEINPTTFESRCCPQLFFAGEILDVDGRIGGFNFQWAWSSAFVAAAGMGQA